MDAQSFENAIVVGIDGSAAAESALDWAADEAERTRRPLVVVHVGDVAAAEVSADPRPYGRELLDEAIVTLVHTHPDVQVTTELLEGQAGAQLEEISRTAAMLVVGRGRRGLAALLLGSVAHHVLGHAHCPTAVVATNRRDSLNTIVVGVSDSPGGVAALSFAGVEAALRGADVVAVRCWSQREWRLAASAALPVTSPDDWESQERAILDACLTPVREAFPTLEIRSVLSSAPPEIALEHEAEKAAMLVLGCRRSDDSRLPRLGPISSWAAHHFDCPVVIVGSPSHSE
jgi:nucleotide-binding universal stress UspA family protein